MSFVALFFALFYDDAARHGAAAVADEFSQMGSQAERFEVACTDGLRGVLHDQTFVTYAERILDLAKAGLGRLRPDECSYLAPLEALVEAGKSKPIGYSAPSMGRPRYHRFKRLLNCISCYRTSHLGDVSRTLVARPPQIR